ncbi:protein vav [Aplysia californica]|uniref:Protein vav n=1 Tax=Aplysia californica TaxID=6500 RepID=A0ABM0K4Z6_APLCA|nr:protein vav [Aplysia californica]
MQRVLKYHLLLKELIKTTDKSNHEREGLEQALEAMLDLSLYVNELKRDHEGLQVIEEIQNSINDLKMPANTSLKDYGRFQKDGELKVLSHMDTRPRNRHIFLFDRVMLMCKAKIVDKLFWGDTYSFKDAILLGEYKIDDSPVGADKKPEKGAQRGWSYPFLMVKQDKSNAFSFFAKTGDQRDKWKDSVALALDNSNPAAGRNFIMHTFDKPRECDVCGKLLRGMFYQGYLCADSQKAVHKECIGKPFQTSPPRRPPRTDKPQHVVTKARAEKGYRGNPSPPSRLKPPLYFAKDDVLEVLVKTDENWWKGRFRGEEGHFPASYVTERKGNLQRKDSYLHTANGAFAPPQSPGTGQMESSLGHRGSLANIANLNAFPWYSGEMERATAQKVLDPLPDGTFLIRVTKNPTRQGELSLSIKYANAVRHIKVNRGEGGFYLAAHRFFTTVQELVDFYQANELADSFPEVCTTLKYPYKKVATNARVHCFAVAIYDYAATSTSQVTLQVGDRVKVLSKTGEDKGWWKGENLRTNRIGYFPLAYVEEEDEPC